MKQFLSIRDGINHKRICPVCQSEIGVPNVVYENRDMKAQLMRVPFRVGNINFVVVDIDSGVLKSVSAWKDGETSLLPYEFKAGNVFQGVSIDCSFCLSFSYTLLFKFYVNGKIELKEIALNSEQIKIKCDKFVHKIRNVHSLNETYYSCTNLQNPTDIKQETIPLVPLNLQNPKETIARIKKLLVFS